MNIPTYQGNIEFLLSYPDAYKIYLVYFFAKTNHILMYCQNYGDVV